MTPKHEPHDLVGRRRPFGVELPQHDRAGTDRVEEQPHDAQQEAEEEEHDGEEDQAGDLLQERAEQGDHGAGDEIAQRDRCRTRPGEEAEGVDGVGQHQRRQGEGAQRLQQRPEGAPDALRPQDLEGLDADAVDPALQPLLHEAPGAPREPEHRRKADRQQREASRRRQGGGAERCG
jgi:hypothetical protein